MIGLLTPGLYVRLLDRLVSRGVLVALLIELAEHGRLRVSAIHAVDLVIDEPPVAADDRAAEIAGGDWPGAEGAPAVADVCLAAARSWRMGNQVCVWVALGSPSVYEDFLIWDSSGARHRAAIVADMRFTTRMAVLAAAVSLPLCAALASYALAADPAAPNVPPDVQIGESASQGSQTTTTTTTPAPPPTVPPPAPHTEVVPHAPPLSDDDDDDDDDDDGGDDDGDD